MSKRIYHCKYLKTVKRKYRKQPLSGIGQAAAQAWDAKRREANMGTLSFHSFPPRGTFPTAGQGGRIQTYPVVSLMSGDKNREEGICRVGYSRGRRSTEEGFWAFPSASPLAYA